MNDRISKLERAVKMLNVRTANHLVGIIPPVGMSAYAPSPLTTGKLVGFLVPISGVLEQAYLHVGEFQEDKLVTFEIRRTRGDEIKTKHFETKRAFASFEPKIRVEAGDLLEVYAEGVLDVTVAIRVLCDQNFCDQLKMSFDDWGFGDEGVRKLLK